MDQTLYTHTSMPLHGLGMMPSFEKRKNVIVRMAGYMLLKLCARESYTGNVRNLLFHRQIEDTICSVDGYFASFTNQLHLRKVILLIEDAFWVH